jgi:hypothetical protein
MCGGGGYDRVYDGRYVMMGGYKVGYDEKYDGEL